MKIRLNFGKHATLWKTALLGAALTFTVCAGVIGYYYHKYAEVVDDRLSEPLFLNATQLYAAPRQIRVGQALTPWYVMQELQRAGYVEAGRGAASALGTYQIHSDGLTVIPGPQSYHAPDAATLVFNEGKLARISTVSRETMETYELEPLLLTPVADDQTRGKRRIVHYDELPPYFVQAVLAIEDRRYFAHHGVDYVRVLGAMRNDLRAGRAQEGASTVTMQLARGFFLSPERKLKRKLIEILIAYRLEQRLNKRQIFEMYANQINLGQWGSFSINGAGEAAHCYFGKDVKNLDLAESATLAALIQRPSGLSPFRHPEGILHRRDLVLDGMVQTGAITRAKADQAKTEPLRLSWNSVNAGEAPYFADLVQDQLTKSFGEGEFSQEGLRVYTSLDADLQREATEAVAHGMKLVDEQLAHAAGRGKRAAKTPEAPRPQVALIVLDPHTGRVLALAGGRDYGASQLNHAVAQRPTGSIFKPFVYAAAFDASLAGKPLPGGAFTPNTMLSDERQDYGRGYSPRNYHGQYHGEVTAQYALAHSLNNATVELASEVGFESVASLARQSGVKAARGTPAVALGAYDATPLQMAGAYTVFANEGVRMEPFLITSVRNEEGDVVENHAPAEKTVLDPRVAYLTLSLMENVISHGTGAEVRRRGFLAPAAGKTGTSHDAWFAGFTSNLLCIVWVGNDDYSDIKLAGGQAAAPIWAEFMRRAVRLPRYADTQEFEPPEGVVRVWLDNTTGRPADPGNPDGYYAAFLAGTEPK